ncbi:MAG: hypothetical protein OXB96_02890 [Candidatus Kaiserbacteria bacterium]|nr:hypothetical protein [Candidatus Kaiserbacteria bacterium]
MITIQKNRRLAILSVICAFAFVTFLGVTTDVTADGVVQSLTNAFVGASVTTSPHQSYGQGVALIPHQVHPLHRDRNLHITQVDEVFTDSAVAGSVAPTSVDSADQRSDLTTVETQYVGQGVALIPDHNYSSVRRNRSWKISHL